MNRVEGWWRDVLKWKERFETLFRRIGLNPDKDMGLRKEELRRYEQILSYRLKDMTAEERMTRRIIKAKRNQLEKQIYPDPFLRLTRNIFKLGSSVWKKIVSGTMPDTSYKKEEQLLRRFGLPEMKEDYTRNTYQPVHSESHSKDEILDFKLTYSDDPHRPVLKGYEASLINSKGMKDSVFIAASMNVDKYQARELLHGRPINTSGDKWLIPDMNDRNADGHMKLREISIQDYDIRAKLEMIPGLKLNETDLDKLSNGLKRGKRMEVIIRSGRKDHALTIEANPLKRDFTFYQGGKKVSIDNLGNSPRQKTQVLSIEPGLKAKGQIKL